LFNFKEGENFNPPPNFGGLTTGILKVFRGLKFEPEAGIGQKGIIL